MRYNTPLPIVKTSTLDPITKKYKLTFEIEDNKSSNKLYYRYKVSNYVFFGNPIENSKYLYSLSLAASAASANFNDMFSDSTENPKYISTKPTYNYFEEDFIDKILNGTESISMSSASSTTQEKKENGLLLLKVLFYKLNEETPKHFCKIIDIMKLQKQLTNPTSDISEYTTFKTNDLEPCPHNDLCADSICFKKQTFHIVLIIIASVFIVLLFYILYSSSYCKKKQYSKVITQE